ncbi:hypothetical protein C8R46DRAFT_890999, partial [Mycena filopes]
STRNTRAERMWVEVGSQFARIWRGFLQRLERLHGLDCDNPHHLWLVHYLFLDEINRDCENFRNYWNHHPVTGKGKNQTPLDMRLVGELMHGKYADSFDEVHPDVLSRYGEEGAHLCQVDIDEAIAADQNHHIRHEAIDVANHEVPFDSELAADIFSRALDAVRTAEIIPDHLGVAPAEWDAEGYPETELVKVGKKSVELTLPFRIWWPRAVTWAPLPGRKDWSFCRRFRQWKMVILSYHRITFTISQSISHSRFSSVVLNGPWNATMFNFCGCVTMGLVF